MQPSFDQATFLEYCQSQSIVILINDHVLAASQESHLIQALGKAPGSGSRRQAQAEGRGLAEQIFDINSVLHHQGHAEETMKLINHDSHRSAAGLGLDGHERGGSTRLGDTVPHQRTSSIERSNAWAL